MALNLLDVTAEPVVPPERDRAFVAEAERRIAAFRAAGDRRRIPGFITANAYICRDALRQVAAEGLAPGRRFCEWGAGFGVVAGLAAMLGYDASGIEIEPDLVAEARRLSADHDLAVRFHLGSYVPDGAFTDTIDEAALHRPLGFRPMDFDVVYVYPWPAERAVLSMLFERFAPPGALLVSYHGGKQLQVHRKP